MRSVLGEIGDLLAVLRSQGEPDSLGRPAGGLADLDALVSMFEANGLRMQARVTGVDAPVTPSIRAVAHRVVQEGLTNAHTHAERLEAALSVAVDREAAARRG